jgi:aspartyl-tRNA(Asn)/glutamyl-tRNA(Gln) amidotransferase subunit B
MRSKEEAHDYRYFPDPDLVPMEILPDRIARIRAAMPELPWQRFERYTAEYGINVKQATQLVDNTPLAAYFDRVVAASKNASQSVNFVLGDLSRLANENDVAVSDSKVTPEHLAELISLVDAKTINSKIAKELLQRMWDGSGSPKATVEGEGLAQTSDPAAIEKFVDDVLAANEKSVADYKAGKTNVAGFLVGQIMKASRGKADPALVQELLKKKLE